MVKKCRSCKTPKWSTDPCNNPDCGSISIVITQKCHRGPVTSRRASGSYDLLYQTEQTTARRSTLGGSQYVADFDGTHYIG